MEATVHHMPAAIRRTGMSSATHVSARPAELPCINARPMVDCHAASQRIGASKVSTAPCQSAGNNCANDSNMIVDLEWRCASGRAMLHWCAVDAPLDAQPLGDGKTDAYLPFKSDELRQSWETTNAASSTLTPKRGPQRPLIYRITRAARELRPGSNPARCTSNNIGRQGRSRWRVDQSSCHGSAASRFRRSAIFSTCHASLPLILL